MIEDIWEEPFRSADQAAQKVTLSDIATGYEFLVLILQRDNYCTNCRQQVQTIASSYDAFQQRSAEVVSVLPEPIDRVKEWQNRYDPPYPLIADPDIAIGEALKQPVRFGWLGNISDFVGRMPMVVIIDCRAEDPEIAWRYAGRSTFDRPRVDELLSELDQLLK